MPKFIHRIVASFLVPSLLAQLAVDSPSAPTWQLAGRRGSMFSEQALTPRSAAPVWLGSTEGAHQPVHELWQHIDRAGEANLLGVSRPPVNLVDFPAQILSVIKKVARRP